MSILADNCSATGQSDLALSSAPDDFTYSRSLAVNYINSAHYRNMFLLLYASSLFFYDVSSSWCAPVKQTLEKLHVCSRGQITRETNHLLPNVTCIKIEGEYKKKKRGSLIHYERWTWWIGVPASHLYRRSSSVSRRERDRRRIGVYTMAAVTPRRVARSTSVL